MPKMAKDDGTVVRMGPVEDRQQDLGDGYTAQVTTFAVAMDGTLMMAGLPDNRCQCPHWGVVQAGQVTFRFADHEETFVAGDAFSVGPGHVPVYAAGTTVLSFSPTEPLRQSAAVIMANARKLMGG
jgi:hypothetical protein